MSAVAVPGTRCAPRRRRGLRPVAALMLLAGLLLLPGSVALAEARGPFVDVVEAHGVVDRTLAGHVADIVAHANANPGEVAAVIVEIDSPGALGRHADETAAVIADSAVPVIAWVGPPGAWAVGGALAVGQAADAFAAAPGTLLGPGAPLDLAAPGADDAAARLGALAEARGRDAAAVRGLAAGEVVAVAPAGEPEAALPEGAPLPDGVTTGDVTVRPADALVEAGLLDIAAGTLPELVEALHGLEVGGATLDTAAATVRFNNLGIVGQVLHALTNPALVYLLVVGGALALLFEVFQPGFGVAGVSGLAVLALGAAGLATLPTSWLGIVVLAAGLLLLAADLALGKLGPLTVAGALAFAAGSALLFRGPPVLDVPLWLVAVATLACLVFFVGVMTHVLRAQGNQALAGTEHLVGETAIVRSMLNPEGHVFARGALWRARAPEAAGRVKTGTAVRIVGLNDRLTLDVEPLEGDGESDERDPASSSVT
jgi:membrane-bound serine protease (ClpP class)